MSCGRRFGSGLGELKGSCMSNGKVKWFNNKKGFGFIIQGSGQDVFVHHTEIAGKGFKTLLEGEEVNFEVVQGEKGPKAVKVNKGSYSS